MGSGEPHIANEGASGRAVGAGPRSRGDSPRGRAVCEKADAEQPLAPHFWRSTVEKQLKTIDLTPSWSGILPALLLIYENGDRAVAVDELRKMARLADAQVAAEKEKS